MKKKKRRENSVKLSWQSKMAPAGRIYCWLSRTAFKTPTEEAHAGTRGPLDRKTSAWGIGKTPMKKKQRRISRLFLHAPTFGLSPSIFPFVFFFSWRSIGSNTRYTVEDYVIFRRKSEMTESIHLVVRELRILLQEGEVGRNISFLLWLTRIGSNQPT